MAFSEPAPPTMKNSSRFASLIAASTPMPWSSSWFHMASIFLCACSRLAATALPVSTVNCGVLLGGRRLNPYVFSASSKPLLRSWVSGSVVDALDLHDHRVR